jgi:hypothetical protein
VAERRLGHAEFGRGARKAALARDREEHPDVVDIVTRHMVKSSY